MAEWHDPEAERKFYKGVKRGELKLTIFFMRGFEDGYLRRRREMDEEGN